MRISQLGKALEILWEIKQPLFLHSMPGIGKSSVIRQFAEKKNVGYFEIRVSQKKPTDLGPVLYVKDGMSDFTTPSWLPSGGEGVLFLDEISDAPKAVQSALYEIIYDRKSGKAKLGDGWRIIMAGNRREDKAAAGKTSSALNNKCVHITLEAHADDLIKYGLKNGWSPVVIGVLNYRPELVTSFNPRSDEFAFTSPRTWEFASDILKENPPAEIRYELLEGTVGKGVATEIEGFLQVIDELPSLKEIDSSPEKAPIPPSPSGKWAITSALAYRTTKDNIKNTLVYVERMPGDNGTMYIRNIIMKDQGFMNTKEYIGYMVEHSDIYIDDLIK